MKRHRVTASFHTNEPAGTQTSISALLTCRSEIKNAIASRSDVRICISVCDYFNSYCSGCIVEIL